MKQGALRPRCRLEAFDWSASGTRVPFNSEHGATVMVCSLPHDLREAIHRGYPFEAVVVENTNGVYIFGRLDPSRQGVCVSEYTVVEWCADNGTVLVIAHDEPVIGAFREMILNINTPTSGLVPCHLPFGEQSITKWRILVIWRASTLSSTYLSLVGRCVPRTSSYILPPHYSFVQISLNI